MPRVLGLDLGSYSLKGVLLDATARGLTVLDWVELRRAEDDTLDQALERSQPDLTNKGHEAALTAVEMVRLLRSGPLA